MKMRRLEINGGLVEKNSGWKLTLPAVGNGYGDAQIDDYGLCNGRSAYPWCPNTRLHLQARFSHSADVFVGTAGFGFWNAPFGDPTIPWPALPQAAWFFFGSPPNDLPLALDEPGPGWCASTLDATTPRAWSMAPAAPLVVLLNRWPSFRQRVWPKVQQRLGISYAPISAAMDAWHDYELGWAKSGCRVLSDGELVVQTEQSPHGPLGFVCWLDNQFMVVTRNGRFRWGTLSVPQTQTLEIRSLTIRPFA